MLVKMIDITNFMNWFLSQVSSMFGTCIGILDRISFWGFSLLDFIIGIAVIGAMLSVLFTFAPKTSNMITMKERSRKGKDKDEK